MYTILANPEDNAPRLVFADWLEETGLDSNVAWAQFIRLNAELRRATENDPRRQKLIAASERTARDIRSRLTIRATLFVKHFHSIFALLPSANLRLDVNGFTVPNSVIQDFPESVARENCMLPLIWDKHLLVAAVQEPFDRDLREKFEFVFNCSFIGIQSPEAQIQEGNNRAFGQHNYEVHDSPLLRREFSG